MFVLYCKYVVTSYAAYYVPFFSSASFFLFLFPKSAAYRELVYILFGCSNRLQKYIRAETCTYPENLLSGFAEVAIKWEKSSERARWLLVRECDFASQHRERRQRKLRRNVGFASVKCVRKRVSTSHSASFCCFDFLQHLYRVLPTPGGMGRCIQCMLP